MQSRERSRGETRKVAPALLGIMWKLAGLLKETGQVPGRPKWGSNLQAGCGNSGEALAVLEQKNEVGIGKGDLLS